MGKPERPHTFYRGWCCSKCGYDPRKDEVRFGDVEDPFIRNRAMRGVMHGDHIVLKSKGGKDTEDNINTLCVLCHMAKTYIEGDFKSGKKGG
jgi:5-methylcytosine-specific restriction endonuclease McrA